MMTDSLSLIFGLSNPVRDLLAFTVSIEKSRVILMGLSLDVALTSLSIAFVVSVL